MILLFLSLASLAPCSPSIPSALKYGTGSGLQVWYPLYPQLSSQQPLAQQSYIRLPLPYIIVICRSSRQTQSTDALPSILRYGEPTSTPMIIIYLHYISIVYTTTCLLTLPHMLLYKPYMMLCLSIVIII
jgi:hypothetical protein